MRHDIADVAEVLENANYNNNIFLIYTYINCNCSDSNDAYKSELTYSLQHMTIYGQIFFMYTNKQTNKLNI